MLGLDSDHVNGATQFQRGVNSSSHRPGNSLVKSCNHWQLAPTRFGPPIATQVADIYANLLVRNGMQ